MPTREQIIEQYGGIENVPDYLRRGFEQQDQAQKRREQQARDHKAKEEAERARVKALRRAPTSVRLDGRTIRWEPPDTASDLPPAGYWVSEEYKGSWTKHGDYVLPHVRSAVLFGDGPAYVETWYHGMALGEMYCSEIVRNPANRLDQIILAVKTYTGRRTRDGRPWVRYLRRHAGMPDITTDERDEAHKRTAG